MSSLQHRLDFVRTRTQERDETAIRRVHILALFVRDDDSVFVDVFVDNAVRVPPSPRPRRPPVNRLVKLAEVGHDLAPWLQFGSPQQAQAVATPSARALRAARAKQ